MSTILVTGGAGFIGSHLCERLLSDGVKVICLDNLDTFYDPNIKIKNTKAITKTFPDLFEIVTGDIRNPDQLKEVLPNNRVPFTEKDLDIQPISPYGATKRAGEILCYSYHHLYGMNIACLRIFTAYGPRQRPEMAVHKFTRFIDQGA